MLYTNFNANILDIKDLIVENLAIFISEVHIYFKLKRRDCVCPVCGAVTNKLNDYRNTIIKDSPIQVKKCSLHYKKHRYHCECCNNKIKVTKQNAYGYRNFKNFRNRILLSTT